LWIGTGGGGVNCYADGKFSNLTTKDGLAGNFVRTLYLDAEGVLWIGTSGGLSRLKAGQLTTFTSQEGLWDDVVSQILEDRKGQLWFGSNRGIYRVPKRELEAVAEHRSRKVSSIVFGKAEGLENLECTGGFCPAGLRTRDGRLWFPTVKGIAIVDPASIPMNLVPPPVVLEEVRVDGQRLAAQAELMPGGTGGLGRPSTLIGQGRPNSLTIAPNARRVEFHYTALSLTAPEKVRFRFQLEGLDPAWVEAEGRRVAEYSYLPPGDYRFRAIACNEDGVWDQTGATLAVKCLPAFWQTLGFQLTCLGAMLGGVIWGVRAWGVRRLRQRLLTLQQQHSLEKERSRIARDIHDELGALLTEISLLSEHGRKHCGQPATVEADLGKISGTARAAVQTADGIVWAVNPRNDSLSHLANYLVHFAEDFFRLTDIRCRLDVPPLLPSIPVSAHDRHHLLLAAKEACNNVVRHSGATEVWVRLKITGQEFSITVEDNGQGFDPETVPADHDGLLNLRHRLADLGGRVEVQSSPGKGTSVQIIAPLNH
jgi:signal transduction histidine kinase